VCVLLVLAARTPAATNTVPSKTIASNGGSAPLTITPAALTTSTTRTTVAQSPKPVLPFDATMAMTHVKKLARDIGVRRAGTEAETQSLQYALDYLGGLGYSAVMTDVDVPDGLPSHNVIATKEGLSPFTIVIGGHIDSKKLSPVVTTTPPARRLY
jgi:hypothetical protein